jgi:hypothetical protein
LKGFGRRPFKSLRYTGGVSELREEEKVSDKRIVIVNRE